MTKDSKHWMELIYFLGSLLGVPITIFLVDAIGRKFSIIVSSCISLLSWVLIGLASTSYVLYIARFLAGLAGVIAFISVPIYIAEIASHRIRGRLVTFALIMFLSGLLLINAVAPFTAFYVPPIIAILLLLSQLLIFAFVPKSPYFLLLKGRFEAAENALNILRRNKDNKKEFKAINAAVTRQQQERGRPIDLLLIPSNRKGLLLVLLFTSTQNFGGFSVIIMNMHMILQAAESTSFNTNLSAIVILSAMLSITVISLFLIDKCGRRLLLIISCILTGTSTFIIAIYFTLKQHHYDLKSVSWIPIAALTFYAMAFKSGLGFVKVVSSELFPTKMKALGMTACKMSFDFFGLLSVKLFKDLIDCWGYHVVFYVFGSYSLMAAVLLMIFLPETKNKTLEEIQLMLKDQNQSVEHEVELCLPKVENIK